MWIESHTNLARHPKTRRLMKLLGWSLPDTIGNLHLFWYWALDFALTGDLSRYTPEQLTADLDLLGVSPEQFLEAMIQAGFLDRIADTLCIHDWIDYQRPKPRQNPAGSFRPAEAGAAISSRPANAGRESDLSAPPRRESSSARPFQTERDPQLAVPPRPEPEQPAQEREESQQAPVTSTRPTSSIRGEMSVAVAISEPDDAATEDTGTPAPRTAEEDIELRKTFPANPDPRALPREPSRPAVAGHDPQLVAPPRRGWWPLYIDFHKKAGTPLTKDAQAKFLAQLAQNPLSAVQQIKDNITRSVRTDFTERDTVLPSNSFRPAVAGHDPQLVVPPRRDAVQQIKQAITHTVRSGILEHAP